MAYRPLTKLRPRFVTSERPQPPVGYDGEEEVETSLSDLVYQSYKARQMSYNPQPTHESIEEMSGLSLSPHSEAPVLSDKAVRSILDGGTDKVAPSGTPLPNSTGDGSMYTGYRVMRPIYDYHTKNKSFLKVHEQLKELGIRNNEFFLLLLNPRLQGVDPHDPNITPELALMVIEECQLNFFYYLREVVRIPQQGAGVVPFELDRATLAAAYCFINDINFYLIKPRQTGKSVGLCAFLSWAFKFGITNGGFAFYANKEKNSKANLKRMKTYIGLLPRYMANMGTQIYDSTGKLVRKTNNIKRYYEPSSGNTADVMNCAISEETAEELGRGDSHNFEFYDEAEFTTCIETTVQVSGMAFNTASYNALKNGMHSCRMFATTPGDLSSEKKCGSALKIVEDSIVWDEKFYDTKPSDLKKYIVKKTNYRVVYIEYNYKQLGLGEAWFIRACSTVGNNIPKIRREILLQRFSGNNMSPFSEEDITELDENQKAPVEIQKFGKGNMYEIKFYVPKEEIRKNRVYFLGLDPSDGTGSDNYAMTVIDPYNFKTIIEFKSPWMSPQGCRELLEYVLTTYIPKAIICVESNRNGITIIDFLKESKILKHRIYASSEASPETLLTREKYDEIGFLQDQLMRRKYFGVHTTVTTRRMMMSILVDSVKFRKDVLTSENLVQDIKDLVIKNDVIKAADGKHDDCVMSWCIAMYAIYFGEKLERYGYRKGELPDDMVLDEDFEQLEELYKNPLIRAQFPTMVSFYESSVRARMEAAYNEKKSTTLQDMADNEMGSILQDIVKADPNYGQQKAFTPQTTTQQQQPVSQNSVLQERWANMNKPKKNSGYNAYGVRRSSNNDDDSWI